MPGVGFDDNVTALTFTEGFGGVRLTDLARRVGFTLRLLSSSIILVSSSSKFMQTLSGESPTGIDTPTGVALG